MKIQAQAIDGVYTIDLTRIGDERGFFARTFSQPEFAELGMCTNVVQCNMSYNVHKGTLRGMHYQTDPAPESKLVRCVRGSIIDIIVDLRKGSPTYLQHVAVELTAQNRTALYVPEYFAHGFQTLEDDTEVIYQVSGFYTPEAERGLRHDDPKLALPWPLPASTLSDKDASWALL